MKNPRFIILFITLLLLDAGGIAWARADSRSAWETAALLVGRRMVRSGAPAVVRAQDYPGIRITDWLNANTVVFSMRNDSLSAVDGEYPMSMYLLDIISSEAALIRAEERMNLEGAVFSPDKRYAAYLRYTAKSPVTPGVNMNLMLTDRETGEEREIFDNVRDFRWVDSDRILLNGWGATYTVDTAGNAENLTKRAGQVFDNGAWLSGGDLYYIQRAAASPQGGTLYRRNLNTGRKERIREQVESFMPSLDQSRAVVLVRPEETRAALMVITMNGEELNVIARGNHSGVLMRAWWSPDRRYIVYSVVLGADDPRNSLYLYDEFTGESTRIAVDVHDPEVSVSPDGGAIAYTFFANGEWESRVLYLEDLV